jgi:hypothetical protein
LTTKGDFSGALDTFRQCVQGVPLMALRSKNELSEVMKIVRDLGEYITAMRIELERKKLVTAVRKYHIVFYIVIGVY